MLLDERHERRRGSALGSGACSATRRRRRMLRVYDDWAVRICRDGGQQGRVGVALPATDPNLIANAGTEIREDKAMSDSVHRVTDVIGVSSESWEAAARNAVETAAKTIRDLRVAEVTRTDVAIEDGTVSSYRVRLGISFKYETED
jgi:dodecin